MPPPQSPRTKSPRRAIARTAICAALLVLSAVVAPSPAQADTKPVAGRFATAEDFVAQGYRDIFDREPDGPGLAYWSDLIRNGERPSEVLQHFIGSPEFAGRVANRSPAFIWRFSGVSRRRRSCGPEAADSRAGGRSSSRQPRSSHPPSSVSAGISPQL